MTRGQNSMLENATIRATSGTKRAAPNELALPSSKRAPNAALPPRDAIIATIDQEMQQYRETDDAEKQMLKDRVAELQAQLKKEKESTARQENEVRKLQKLNSENHCYVLDVEKQRNGIQEEKDALTFQLKHAQTTNRDFQSQHDAAMNAIMCEKNDLDLKLKFALDAISRNQKAHLDAIAQITEKEAAARLAEIRKKNREHQLHCERKNKEIKAVKGRAYQQQQSAANQIAQLTKANEETKRAKDDLKGMLMNMYMHYHSLHAKNTILCGKLQAIANENAPSGAADWYANFLNGLRGQPLEELKEYQDGFAKQF